MYKIELIPFNVIARIVLHFRKKTALVFLSSFQREKEREKKTIHELESPLNSPC